MQLTPEQAADVIRWRHNFVNTDPETGQRFHRDKVSLGLAAIQLGQKKPERYLPSMEEPALTPQELAAGIKLLTADEPSKAVRTMSRLQQWGARTQANLDAEGIPDAKSQAYKD